MKKDRGAQPKRKPAAQPGPAALEPERLRWRCDPHALPFASTRDVDPEPSVIGQDTAMEALRFGLECRASNQNIFVRGLHGTGRMTMVRRLLTAPRVGTGT